MADLLRHIGRCADDCDARLAGLERQRDALAQRPGGSSEERMERLRAEVIVVQSELKRLHVATTLVQSYMQARREQLAAALDSETTTMEVS